MFPTNRRFAPVAHVLVIAAIALVTALPAYAQRDGVIAGRIVDTEGNPVADVRITLFAVARGSTRVLTTDENGDYMGRGLQPDVYRITIEAEGFGPQQQEMKINLGMNTVDVTLSAPTLVDSTDYEALNELYERGFEAWQGQEWAEAKAALGELVAGIAGMVGDEVVRMRLSALEILGQAHFQTDELEQAEAVYEEMLGMDPDNVAAHSWLAQVFTRQQDFEGALPHLRRAAELSPDDAALQYNTGAVMLQLGVIDEGLAAMERSIELRPNFPLAHKNLGYAYLQAAGAAAPEDREAYYEKALTSMRTYLEQSPDAPDRADVEGMIGALEAQIGQ